MSGTPGGFQFDAVLKSLVVPIQVEVGIWAATPAGDRQMTASKAAPRRFMGTVGWGASWLAPAVWNDGPLNSCRRSPPLASQERNDYRRNQKSKQ